MPNFHLLLGHVRAEILSDRAARRGTSILAELKRVVDESVTKSNSSPIGFAGLEPEGKPLKEGKGEASCSLLSSPFQGLLLPETPSLGGKERGVGESRGAGEERTHNGTKMVPSSKKDVQEKTGFAEFWALYPRKVGRGRALLSYKGALKKGVSELDLLAGLERSRVQWRKEGRDPSLLPHASTWLNQERWTDEYEEQPLARHLLVTSDYRKAEHRVAELALPADEHLSWLEKIRAAKNVEELAAIVARAEAGRG